MNPLISIVTVCFNSAKTIRQTIESVLNQTYTNIEYILVDGKSTDNTVAIIEEYAPQFAAKGIAYRWLSEPDAGIYDAMNKGIRLSTGKWVGIINSDDWYELDACETLINFIKNHPDCDLLCGNVNYYIETEKFLFHQVQKSQIKNIKSHMNIIHPSVFVNKRLYQEKLFSTKYKIVSDWEWMLYFYTNKANIKYIDKIISNFRWGGAGCNFNFNHILERYKVRRTFNISPQKNLIYELITLYLKFKIKAILRLKYPFNKAALNKIYEYK